MWSASPPAMLHYVDAGFFQKLGTARKIELTDGYYGRVLSGLYGAQHSVLGYLCFSGQVNACHIELARGGLMLTVMLSLELGLLDMAQESPSAV